MSKTPLSEKAFKGEMKRINKIKNDSEFEKALFDLYENCIIPPDIKKKELNKLIHNIDRKAISALAVVLSNAMSAVITTVISPSDYNNSSTIVLFLLLFAAIVVILYSVFLGAVFVFTTLASKDLKWRNIRIKIIIDSMDKNTISSMIHTNAQEKKRNYFLGYVKDVSLGIIAALAATVVVWKMYYHL